MIRVLYVCLMMVCCIFVGCGGMGNRCALPTFSSDAICLTWENYSGEENEDPEKAFYIVNGKAVGEGQDGFAKAIDVIKANREAKLLNIFPDHTVIQSSFEGTKDDLNALWLRAVPFRRYEKQLQFELAKVTFMLGIEIRYLSGMPATKAVDENQAYLKTKYYPFGCPDKIEQIIKRGDILLTWINYDGEKYSYAPDARYIINGEDIGDFEDVLECLSKWSSGANMYIFPDRSILLRRYGCNRDRYWHYFKMAVPFRYEPEWEESFGDGSKQEEKLMRIAQEKKFSIWFLAGAPGAYVEENDLIDRNLFVIPVLRK
ncbi:MAG: hypothetical protein JEZ07_17500 [Phycisphaerae bacterium]|nr:hypothetical protein [Phycisphaerae bacterium]